MSNKTYDILKRIVQIILPAVGTFYVAIADVWGLPYASEVAKTVTAVVTFLSAVLGFTNALYNKTKDNE